ncbi:hypothetical protein COOONC_02164 [Cooperia oncophora]
MGEDRGDGSSAGPPPFGVLPQQPAAQNRPPQPPQGCEESCDHLVTTESDHSTIHSGSFGTTNFSSTLQNGGFAPVVVPRSVFSYFVSPKSATISNSLKLFDVYIAFLNRVIDGLKVCACPFQRMGVWSVDYIPRGVRFGPLLGEVKMNGADCTPVCPAEASSAGGSSGSGPSTPTAPTTSPKEWKVMSPSGGRALKTILVEDDSRCNWMKFVNVAVSNETQNLVACQVIA